MARQQNKHLLSVSVPIFLLIFFLLPINTFAASKISLLVSPAQVIQGEPAMISVAGLGTTTLGSVKKISFGTQPLGVFMYKNKPTAFVGIDLNKKAGTYAVSATLKNGTIIKTNLIVKARTKYSAPLGIPAKLGGNTAASQKNLVDTLAAENKDLASIQTAKSALWTQKFQYPIVHPIVTDPYGYTRSTGPYSINHKGTDFHANEGTSVLAINKGVVRKVKEYTEYGKTIVVDHGIGLSSFYMHLSKINVSVGDTVSEGQVIGLSGQTGYADQPHLHLTIRINNISIDPIKFLNLFR